ncbi:unnamed protein product [Aphanomyces euteiches]|nr:hypothetical protein LEN26_014138 [Aphanomyces euteiches]KAH9127629.1 hypothetical protein AeMF1_002083 [Aphanomyces euteiches]KAH9188780.1 hypothetical protein AeNC1_009243 [Aphanomyces euteiches]
MCRPFEIESRLHVSHLLPGFNVPQQQPLFKQGGGFMQPPTAPTSFKPQQFEVAPIDNFDDLLDCSILDDDGTDLNFNVGDEDFDATELAILSKYVDEVPLDETDVKTDINVVDQPGVLTLNLLDDMTMDLNMISDEDMMLTNIQLKAPVELPAMAVNEWKPEAPQVRAPEAAFPFKSRRFCSVDGCEKRSRSHGLCIAHGGGRRCAVEGCDKSSQGGNLCIKHGGGKRCQVNGCDKAAQSNMLCKMHGGGPRCLFANCHRSSQGGGFCRTHGGGKRCLFEGCDKGTQRGDFCALHGGSRLCGVSGCMRNDRGGGFCATHGGGKRCSQEGCNKPCRRQGMCSTHLRLSGTE